MPIKQEENKLTERIKLVNNDTSIITNTRRVYRGTELVYGLYDANYNVGSNSGFKVTPSNELFVWGKGVSTLPTPTISSSSYTSNFEGWYNSKDLNIAINIIDRDTKADTNLYAKLKQSKTETYDQWSGWSTDSNVKPSGCPSWATKVDTQTKTETIGGGSSFSPITSALSIDNAPHAYFWNTAREQSSSYSPTYWYFPPEAPALTYKVGYGGPHYDGGSEYGNCTWWCAGRSAWVNGTGTGTGSSLAGLGNANSWYSNFSGSKDTDFSYLNPGDIVTYTNSSLGHVTFVEQVDGDTVYMSESAATTRHSAYDGNACLVFTVSLSSMGAGKTISNGYFSIVCQGILRTGSEGGGGTTITYYKNRYKGSRTLTRYYNYSTDNWDDWPQ